MTDQTPERSFDALAKGLASGDMSRRRALRLMGAALVGGTLASLGIGEAAADPPGCKRNGKHCNEDEQCCSGNCANGTCAASCAPGTKLCSNGQCANCCEDADCSGCATCQSGTCACPSGTVLTANGTCARPCGPGVECPSGRCLPTNEGLFCHSGGDEVGTCVGRNQDCPAGSLCFAVSCERVC